MHVHVREMRVYFSIITLERNYGNILFSECNEGIGLLQSLGDGVKRFQNKSM